jgi:hypothetical protein
MSHLTGYCLHLIGLSSDMGSSAARSASHLTAAHPAASHIRRDGGPIHARPQDDLHIPLIHKSGLKANLRLWDHA